MADAFRESRGEAAGAGALGGAAVGATTAAIVAAGAGTVLVPIVGGVIGGVAGPIVALAMHAALRRRAAHAEAAKQQEVRPTLGGGVVPLRKAAAPKPDDKRLTSASD